MLTFSRRPAHPCGSILPAMTRRTLIAAVATAAAFGGLGALAVATLPDQSHDAKAAPAAATVPTTTEVRTEIVSARPVESRSPRPATGGNAVVPGGPGGEHSDDDHGEDHDDDHDHDDDAAERLVEGERVDREHDDD